MGNRRKQNAAAAQKTEVPPVTNLFNIMQTINDRDIEIREKSELIEKLKKTINDQNITIGILEQNVKYRDSIVSKQHNKLNAFVKQVKELESAAVLKNKTIDNLKQSLEKVNGENQALRIAFFGTSGRHLKESDFDPYENRKIILPDSRLNRPKPSRQTGLDSFITNRPFMIIFIILFFASIFLLSVATFLNTELIIKFIIK